MRINKGILLSRLRVRATLVESFNFDTYDKETNPFRNGFFKDKYDPTKIQELLDKLEEKYKKYINEYSLLDLFSENVNDSSVLNQIKSVLHNDLSAQNLAVKLYQNNTSFQTFAKNYDKAYKDFYLEFTKSFSLLEKTTSALRNEINLHHFGMIDANGFLKEFSLDTKSMEELFEKGNLFKLDISKNAAGTYSANLKTKTGLERESIIQELTSAVNGKKVFNNRYSVGELINDNYNIAYQLYSSKDTQIQSLRSNGTKSSNLKQGRRYEAFDKGMAFAEGPYSYLMKIQDSGYVLDTLPWVSGGDVTYIDQQTNLRYNISDKFFNFNEEGNMGTGYKRSYIGLTSFNTLVDALDTLAKPEMIKLKYNRYSEQLFKAMDKNTLAMEFLLWNTKKNGHIILTLISELENPYLIKGLIINVQKEIQSSNVLNIDELLEIIFKHTISEVEDEAVSEVSSILEEEN